MHSDLVDLGNESVVIAFELEVEHLSDTILYRHGPRNEPHVQHAEYILTQTEYLQLDLVQACIDMHQSCDMSVAVIIVRFNASGRSPLRCSLSRVARRTRRARVRNNQPLERDRQKVAK